MNYAPQERSRWNRLAGVGLVTGALFTGTLVVAPAADAATARNGVCGSGEFCYFFNSDEKGSVSDFTTSVPDYGTTEPSCYDFKGAGSGKGMCIKNHAASVWNRTSKSVTVYFNSNYGGTSQTIAAGGRANLKKGLKNNNASHYIGTRSSTTGCSTSGLGDPRSCAGAVAWAKSHVTSSYHSDYYRRCDHIMGLAYGWSASGSATAYTHWTQIPAKYKHSGS